MELTSLTDPTLVPLAVAEAIGLPSGMGTASADGVARTIGSKRLLLVLDNCEHLIDAVAHMVESILRFSSHAVILATSRETLRTRGECVYRVPPLDVPQSDSERPAEIIANSAVQLFLTRGKALHISDLHHEQALRLIATICRKLDGIPLAIEFAAAPTLSLWTEKDFHVQDTECSAACWPRCRGQSRLCSNRENLLDRSGPRRFRGRLGLAESV
ncbi:MAG: hypothetical protein WDN49_24240 [Acetobacteraceae bacterium]